jgi:tetratricopeptide (TPR) repeat protein
MNITEKKLAAAEPTETATLDTPDTEKLLLARLESSTTGDDYFRWMLFVVGFYRGINNIEAAARLLEDFIKVSNDVEQSAHCYLALGQIATDEQRHDAALDYFTAALAAGPKKRKVLYVLHNNIGFCLNSVGRFSEGEKHCREAIAIDWTRASGYRNLGLSLNGQKNIAGAAWALAEAVKADEADNRARVLLEKLLALHPVLGVQCPWVMNVLNSDLSATVDIPLM